MSPAALKLRNVVFIVVLVLTNSFGNVFLALGIDAMPAFEPRKFLNYTRLILSNVWFVAGVALLIFALVAQLSMYTWADLSYVLPMTASSYALIAILGRFFLGEMVSPARWAGVGLISFGVILVAETPPWTHDTPPPEEQP